MEGLAPWGAVVTKTNNAFNDVNNQQNAKTFSFINLSKSALRLHKAVPLQAWSRPEGSRKLKFLDFMTTAQEGGKVVSLTHRPHLPQGNSPGTHFC